MSRAPQDEEDPSRYTLLKEPMLGSEKKYPGEIDCRPCGHCAPISDEMLAREAKENSPGCFERHVCMKDPDAPFGISILCWTILNIVAGLIMLAIMLPIAHAERAKLETAALATQTHYARVEEIATTFNVSEFADTLRKRRHEVADDFLLDMMKRSFVNVMLIRPTAEYVCVTTYSGITPLRTVLKFEELMKPHFQLSPTLSSSSELCFIPS